MLQIMEGVSTWQPGQGWQFKLEYDEQFATDYPVVVKQQVEQWRIFYNKSVPLIIASTVVPSVSYAIKLFDFTVRMHDT